MSNKIENKRKELNRIFNAFIKKYGDFINNKQLKKILEVDIDYDLVSSLQVLKNGSIKGADILFKRTIVPATIPTKANSLLDAFIISVNYRGKVVPRYIASLLHSVPENEVDEALENKIVEMLTNEKFPVIYNEKSIERPLCFINPVNNRLEEAEEYLSGNVKSKLETAKQFAEIDQKFHINVQQLEHVIPDFVPLEKIQFKLGTVWMPTDIVEDFIYRNFGFVQTEVRRTMTSERIDWEVKVLKNKDSFQNKEKGIYFGNDRESEYDLGNNTVKIKQPAIYDKLGHNVVEFCLNNALVTILRYKVDAQGNKIQKLNAAGEWDGTTYVMEQDDALTNLLQDKKDNIQREFKSFVINNPEYITRLEEIYNRDYNNYVRRTWAVPNVKQYPGANTLVELRDAQKLGVRRALIETTGGFLGVGVGKTFTIITAAMEARRMKLANKPMIVVLNATLEGFVADAKFLYPSAKILSPNLTGLSAADRKKTFAKIATQDWDMVIIPQSQFEMIPDHPNRVQKLINSMIEEILSQIKGLDEKKDANEIKDLRRKIDSFKNMINKTMKGGGEDDDDDDDEIAVQTKDPKKTIKVKDIAREMLAVEGQIRRQTDRKVDDFLYFEELGIDMLFVDEAHAYKRLGFTTNMTKVKGIDTAGSKRSLSTLLKVQYIHEINKGRRNVSFWTGTPVSNTVAEMWTLTKFLNPDILRERNLLAFDAFVAEHAEVTQDFEMNAGGTYKPTYRLKKYKEIQKLYDIWGSYAYVVIGSDVLGKKEGEDDDDYIKSFLQEIKDKGKPDKQPLLKIQKNGERGINNIIIPRSDEQTTQVKIFSEVLRWYENLQGFEKLTYRSIPLQIYNLARRATISLKLLPSIATKALIPMHNVDDPFNKVNFCADRVLEVWQQTKKDRLTQLIFCDSFKYEEDGVEMFNVFKEIKRILISNNVPENEIAIINDYTKKKREKLIQDLNDGVVRIAMGSTLKLGTGLNVQKKLIEVHHIDAPDRPMDFEQRNGRIIRAGNFNPEVNITTYGIEKTMDAVAYGRLEIKQKFINQILTMSIKDDIVEDELDEGDGFFESMKSMLTGSTTAIDLMKAKKELKSLLGQLDYENTQKISKAKQLTNTQKLLEKKEKDLVNATKFLEIVKKSTIGDSDFEIVKASYNNLIWTTESTKTIIKTNSKGEDVEKSEKIKFSDWLYDIVAKEPQKFIDYIKETKEFDYRSELLFLINDNINLRIEVKPKVDSSFYDKDFIKKQINKDLKPASDNIFNILADGLTLFRLLVFNDILMENESIILTQTGIQTGYFSASETQSSITRTLRGYEKTKNQIAADVKDNESLIQSLTKALAQDEIFAELDKKILKTQALISELNTKMVSEQTFAGLGDTSDRILSDSECKQLGKFIVDLGDVEESSPIRDDEREFLLDFISRSNEKGSHVTWENSIKQKGNLIIFNYRTYQANKALESNLRKAKFEFTDRKIKRNKGKSTVESTYTRTFDLQDVAYAKNILSLIRSDDKANHELALDVLIGINEESMQQDGLHDTLKRVMSKLKGLSIRKK